MNLAVTTPRTLGIRAECFPFHSGSIFLAAHRVGGLRTTFKEQNMTIQVGDRIPAGNFTTMTADGPAKLSTEELLAGKTVVLVSVPGAFTPTCSARHLPGFVDHIDAIKAKGVDTVAFMAVNDVFVMNAWGKAQHADGKITMLADGNGEVTSALGLEMDASAWGMGKRGQRFALVVKDGVVTHVNVETGGEFRVSAADYVLGQL
jgi:peroxiredoxin